MGAVGALVPPRTYFEKIQAVLRKYEVLFVADEVICGFGRTGAMWGSQTYDLKPDILTMAKALSSGYIPIAALMISEEIYRAIAPETERRGVFGHGFTYSGHPVASAVALETLKIYDEIDLIGLVREAAPRMQAGISRFADHPLAGEVAGIGMLSVVELVADKATRAPFDAERKVGQYLIARAQANGLIIRALGDRIGFSPPLVMTGDEIDDMYARFARALDETWEWVQGDGAAP